ncbi:MAG: alkaline phosphatase family protein [Acetobacteraceae bacterium]
MKRTHLIRLSQATLLASTILAGPHAAFADRNTAIDGNNGTLPLPTGQYITPTVPTGAVQQPLNPGLPAYPNFVAGMAVKSQLSPDGTTLAIICAGQNSLYRPDATTGAAVDVPNSTQYIFLYDVAGANKTSPVLTQVLKPVNSFVGLVFAADGTLYAAGGRDDQVIRYGKSGGQYTQTGTLALGHGGKGIGSNVQPNAGALAISGDGATMVAVNNYNDSISVIDLASFAVRFERDLRPYANEGPAGAPGGTFPYAVVMKGNIAFVSSDRDREVIVLDVSSASTSLVKRIKLDGNALGMAFNPGKTTLYVAQDNADEVAAIDTTSYAVTQIDARAPAGTLVAKTTGASTSNVTVSPDGKTLYAVNSGSNSIAVIPLTGTGAGAVAGLIPTAYEPHDITFSPDGSWMYIINGKNDTGPNPGYRYSNTDKLAPNTYPGGNVPELVRGALANQYQFQLERASLVSAQVPTSADLPALTAQVALNNGYSVAPVASDVATMNTMRGRIQHVIYIVKENRTFDQMLGDLGNGSNGDPTLTVFGKRITPNLHGAASKFVTLDNFMDPGDGSMDGWSWAMAGRVTNTETITQQINYAFVNRGLSYESEGSNRNVPVGLTSNTSDPNSRDHATNGSFSTNTAALPGGTANALVGPANHAATDAPYGVQMGYIFDAVLQAGGTVRDYGFLVNNIGSIGTKASPIMDPFASGVVQVAPVSPSLLDKTDVYFRGYDQNYPDLWRYNEWKREFDAYDANGGLPSLSMVRFSHDHTGAFGTALAGVNTPETQQADNDLAVGKLIDAVAHSAKYAGNTLILVTEDDCQDGPDHFDSHRTTAYAVGPYVKQGAVVSTRYNQVSMLRTIEDLLGTQHINLNTLYQRPMADVFDVNSSGAWTFTAVASRVLSSTTLLAQGDSTTQYAEGPDIAPKHDAAYWAKVTRGFDFSDADRVPTDLFNQVLWTGLMDGKPYPTHRSGVRLNSTDVISE